MNSPSGTPEFQSDALTAERRELLQQLEDRLETPMLVLGFVWLALLIVELLGNLSAPLEWLGTAIWIVFLLDFALTFTLAPHKIAYLKTNWLTALALLVPALRVFRICACFACCAWRGLRAGCACFAW